MNGSFDVFLGHNSKDKPTVRQLAAGMYPQGASLVGVLDMSGNLWEWCLNKYDDPRDVTLGGDARRVVRGGSWGGSRARARSAYRLARDPRSRPHRVGWRLACSSPNFEPLNTE